MLRNITVGKATIFSRQAGQRVLLVIGVAFIGALIVKSWDELGRVLNDTDLFLFFISILVAFIGNFLSAVLLHTLFIKYEIDVNARKASLLFFWSQVTKYVPGKIWPIVYQVTAVNSEDKAGSVILANVDMMAAAIVTTGAVSVALMLSRIGWMYSVIAMTIGLIACLLICRGYWWRLLVRVSLRVLPLDRANVPDHPGKASVVVICVYYIGFALTFVGSGTLMLLAVFGLSGREAMQLIAHQGLSWIMGVVAFVVPAGMGVREAAFIWLGATVSKTISVESLAAMAIVFRAWYLLQEILGVTIISGWNVIAVADERTEHD